MEDETTKKEDQPSTSKKESHKSNSRNDLYDEREHDNLESNSTSSVSATYSARSRIDMADVHPEVPKPPIGKREPKPPERKKRGRRPGGRVEKRRRSFTRRKVRRVPKRKSYPRDERKGRDLSVSTIFTRLSSRSGSRTPACIHCGHRCCRRRAQRFVVRFAFNKRRFNIKRYAKLRKQKIVGIRRLKNLRVRRLKNMRVKNLKKKSVLLAPKFAVGMGFGSKQVQTGSRSQMLSPLFINTNSTPTSENLILHPQNHCEVTPEMIYESLRSLTLWKQDIQTILIMEYIKRNFPVNPVETELFAETKEKLRIAAIVGIVDQTADDFWCLSCALQNRKLTVNHVTLFWQAYADTLSPISKKKVEVVQKERMEKKTSYTTCYQGPRDCFDDRI